MLVAPFLLAAGMLVASGAGKLIRPSPAVAAMRSAGLPGGGVAARVLGLVEIGVGVAALVAPSPVTAGAVGALYLGFVAVLIRLLRRGGASTCGCVGGRDAPPSPLHVALDLAALAVSVAVAVRPVPGIDAVVTSTPLAGIPALAGLAAAGALLVVAVVEVPRAWASYRPAHEEHAASPQPIVLGRPR